MTMMMTMMMMMMMMILHTNVCYIENDLYERQLNLQVYIGVARGCRMHVHPQSPRNI